MTYNRFAATVTINQNELASEHARSCRYSPTGYGHPAMQPIAPDCTLLDYTTNHTVRICTEWVHALDIDVSSWAGKSWISNSTENISKVTVSSVYHNRKQYCNVRELKNAVPECCHSTDTDFLQRSVSSMQVHCVQVNQEKGKTPC